MEQEQKFEINLSLDLVVLGILLVGSIGYLFMDEVINGAILLLIVMGFILRKFESNLVFLVGKTKIRRPQIILSNLFLLIATAVMLWNIFANLANS